MTGHLFRLRHLTLPKVFFLCVFLTLQYGCATSLASPAPPEIRRTIDWEQANAEATRSKTTQLARSQIRNVVSNSSEELRFAVPLLLPALSLDFYSSNGIKLKLIDPRVLITDAGYTAFLKSEDIDIVIDASDSMMLTSDSSGSIPPQNFVGEFQAIEGNGGEVSIGRFGALYSVQLMCNKPAIPDCVTESMVMDVIESLVVLPYSGAAQ